MDEMGLKEVLTIFWHRKIRILFITAIFIALGVAGSTDFAKKLGARVENNKIVVNEKMETTVKGLFACGDCTGGIYQISKAIYEGTIAGISQLHK